MCLNLIICLSPHFIKPKEVICGLFICKPMSFFTCGYRTTHEGGVGVNDILCGPKFYKF